MDEDKSTTITVSAISINRPTATVTGSMDDKIQTYIDKFTREYKLDDDVKAGKVEVKLLYQGRILVPTATARESNFVNACVVHLVVKAIQPLQRHKKEIKIQTTNNNNNNRNSNNNNNNRPRGLNRLVDFGFSQDEIEELRTMYRAEMVAEHPNMAPSTENDLAGEERWLDAMLGRENRRLRRANGGGNNNNDDDDEADEEEMVAQRPRPVTSMLGEFTIGFFLGFGLGFIGICFMFVRTLPITTRTGVALGITLSMILSMSVSKRKQ